MMYQLFCKKRVFVVFIQLIQNYCYVICNCLFWWLIGLLYWFKACSVPNIEILTTQNQGREQGQQILECAIKIRKYRLNQSCLN